MVTLAQLINELVAPIFGVLGILIRGLGALGIGFAAGQVLRHTLAHKMRMRFYVPLIFLGVVALFGVTAYGPWSSPGAVGLLGVGVFMGYVFVKSATESAGEDQDDYYEAAGQETET
jgi:hypothetical protein